MSEDDINAITQAVETLSDVSDQGAQSLGILSDDMRSLADHFADASQASNKLGKSFANDISGAIRGLVADGDSLANTLRNLALSMADSALNVAIGPAIGAFSSWASGAITGAIPFADGGVIAHGNVKAFAHGGVVNSPQNFALNGGMGLMGEAGPEAIMPLQRGSDGRLGVAAGGHGQAINVTFNVSTPDVQGFQKSQSQIAAQMSRLMNANNKYR